MSEILFNPVEHSHRRCNPLTGEWVLVSPHRSKRPWRGQNEKLDTEILPVHDAGCQLCPGNKRISGQENPDYKNTFVFTNDFAALMPDTPDAEESDSPLFKMDSVRGVSRVLCFSPDHNKSLPELRVEEIASVIDAFSAEIEALGKTYVWVQVFENKGEMMGCSQPHPHGQVWASDFMPSQIARKDALLKTYYDEQGSNLLTDYVQAELDDGSRIIFETENWLALVPYWASWPFESMLLPKKPWRRISELNKQQREDLALAIKQLTTRYDNLFECAFPYSMGWHYAPFFKAQNDVSHWLLHALFYPPLLRSASVRKFMVGYEMLAESQRDLTPEQAAQRLREVSDVHYKKWQATK